jgi:hypothetical protein
MSLILRLSPFLWLHWLEVGLMCWRYTWGVSRRSSAGCIRTSERSTERGWHLQRHTRYPPSTLRERTAGRALSTVCRKRACGSFGATLIHFKTRRKQY